MQNSQAYKIITILALSLIIEGTMASVQIQKKIQLSSKRAFFSTIQAEDRLFFIGGFEKNDFIASNIIDVFNLTSGSWDPPLNLTTARGRISTVVVGPRIYMASGQEYSNAPSKLNTETHLIAAAGFTSGPTVRRTVRLSLNNSTLTVVGYFSVDFMNLTNNQWTYNENLTNVMSQLFDATTIALNNFVFIIGGTNVSTQVPSTSVWMIDSPSSTPLEIENIVPAGSTTGFVGSWFDDTHGAAVIHFTDKCFVYHTATHSWLQRDASNNSIASLSFENSTVVFFSDGFWTIDWDTMNDTWTSLDQVSFAFTIANQLVYCASNQLSVVTSDTSQTQVGSIGTPLLTVQLSSFVHVLVNSTGAVFMYYSSTKQLVLALDTSPLGFLPVRIFRGNDTIVHIISKLDTQVRVFSLKSTGEVVANATQIRFIPDVLVQNYLYSINAGQFAPANDPMNRGFDVGFENAVWTQSGDLVFATSTTSFDSDPPSTTSTTYKNIDVYNYVENQWESSIALPANLDITLNLPLMVLEGSVVVFAYNNISRLNETGSWIQIPSGLAFGPGQWNHPTYNPAVVMNDTIYMRDQKAGYYFISTLDVTAAVSKLDVYGTSRQITSMDRKLVMSVQSGTTTTWSIVTYDLDTDIWRGLSLPQAAVMASTVVYEEFLLVLSDALDSIDYLDLTTEQWYQQSFDNPFIPASMFTLSPSTSTSANSSESNTTLVIAGGYHKIGRQYTDEVQFVVFNLTLTVTPTPVGVINQPINNIPLAGDNNSNVTNDSTIIIAIVIPVGVAVIAAVLLAILLVIRKQRKNRSMSVSMTGLEQQQFGQWFVPYQDITFGDQLGQGGNGQVFKGKWKSTDVALKVSMTQARQSVVSELSLMINMRPHPNVVQALGFSVHPETESVILILEYCNGGSLDVALDQYCDVKKKHYWLTSICKGISHLHSNNIVHRDIAARNVLLHQGEPKLTDFGLSRLVDEQQRGTTKSELGPIRWMAPESLKNKQYSPKSDIWSFGILMFEVLEQQEPHLNEDPFTVGRKIRDEGVIPQLSSESSAFLSVMQKCCQMSPSARPTIDQVLEMLEQITL